MGICIRLFIDRLLSAPVALAVFYSYFNITFLCISEGFGPFERLRPKGLMCGSVSGVQVSRPLRDLSNDIIQISGA